MWYKDIWSHILSDLCDLIFIMWLYNIDTIELNIAETKPYFQFKEISNHNRCNNTNINYFYLSHIFHLITQLYDRLRDDKHYVILYVGNYDISDKMKGNNNISLTKRYNPLNVCGFLYNNTLALKYLISINILISSWPVCYT